MPESDALAAALAGDETGFRRLVEPHRVELHAHCYRMLGSVHDAEDALQDTLLRAWRGLPGFEKQASIRPWLYRIATNVCLDEIARRPRRSLPMDHGGPTDPAADTEREPVPSIWLEPYPDERLGIEGGLASPEARYEQREALELAFVTALQHLPGRQRAILVLHHYLGLDPTEIADVLDIPAGTARSRLHYAHRAMRALPDRAMDDLNLPG